MLALLSFGSSYVQCPGVGKHDGYSPLMIAAFFTDESGFPH